MAWEWRRNGATRYVLLTTRYAFKFPRWCSYTSFLWGLLANVQEVAFSETKDSRLCPVLFYIPFGLLVVMPRCEKMSLDFWFIFNSKQFKEGTYGRNTSIPVERKPDSFGWYKGRLVALDYGT